MVKDLLFLFFFLLAAFDSQFGLGLSWSQSLGTSNRRFLFHLGEGRDSNHRIGVIEQANLVGDDNIPHADAIPGSGQDRNVHIDALRQVIDISGDGANNRGRPVTDARDEAVAKGITVNGLPIMLKKPRSYWDIEDLDLYYRDCVIGGQGAFMVPVRERHQFAEAIKTKIIREIAGPVEVPLIQPAQAEPGMNCLVAQRPRLDQWRN